MKDKLKFSRNLSLTGWLVVCLSVLQIFESLVVMFVNLFTQMPAVIDDTQKTLLSNLEQELSKRGSSLLDVLNQFEVIQLVLLIIMSFFIISLFQNLKGYLNGVHKIFELDLYIVIMIFSNLFLIMTSVLLFLIGNQGIIEDMVETISMILVLVYLLFGMGFYIKFNSLKVDFFGFKKHIFYLGVSYIIFNLLRMFVPYSQSNIFTVVHILYFLVSFSYWIYWSMFFFKSSQSLMEGQQDFHTPTLLHPSTLKIPQAP